MRAVVQRVRSADVTVAEEVIGQIELGLVILLGVETGDSDADCNFLAEKIVGLRIFGDAEGKMNLSLLDVAGAALIVSQFTLAAETRGNRPGFSRAAAPEDGRRLYEQFSAAVAGHGVAVGNGVFGADMQVALVNDGPVTIWLDTAAR